MAAEAPAEPLDRYREQFPICRERAYLNHAALGPLSLRVVEAVERYARDLALRADHATPEWAEQRERTRGKLARSIGADADEVAMVKNTPDALGTVAAGLRWRPGDRVVTSDQEFPANVLPWLSLAERGVEVTLVPSREGGVPIEGVVGAIDGRTRLVALSWVEFSTGYRNDLAAIARACRERGALLAVDGIQGVGALRMDVRTLGIDFLAFSTHKWLLGPLGVGWLYCRREALPLVEPTIVGHGSVTRRASWLDYGLDFWPDARRFEAGAPNGPGLAGAEAALDLLAEVGMDRVEAQIRRLTDRLAEGLAERGYRTAYRRGADDWSGIVAFASAEHATDALHARLEAAGVSTSVREGRVRVSPHFYNTDEDVDRLLAALP